MESLAESSIRTSRHATPVYLVGKRLGWDEVTVAVEVTAVFTSDESAAEFEAAVRELLEQA